MVSNIFATEAKLPFGFACNQASPNIVIAWNFVNTFKIPLQPGPFVSILYILYTAETAEPPIIVLIVIN